MFFIVSCATTFSMQVSLPYLVPLQSLETYKVKHTRSRLLVWCVRCWNCQFCCNAVSICKVCRSKLRTKYLTFTISCILQYPRLFSQCTIKQRCGVLLYGAPGTGKTLLAGAVAKEFSLNFVSIKVKKNVSIPTSECTGVVSETHL